MANNLRAKITKLRHDGKISETELTKLLNKLNGHDFQVQKDVLNLLAIRMKEREEDKSDILNMFDKGYTKCYQHMLQEIEEITKVLEEKL